MKRFLVGFLSLLFTCIFNLNLMAQISGNLSVCVGSSSILSDSAVGGSWSLSNSVVASINSSGVIIGVSAGTDTVSYTNTSGVTIAVVNVYPLPVASFTLAGHTENINENDLLTYTGTTSPANSYSWNFGGGTAIPGIGVGPHLVSWASAGLKSITLTVTNAFCTSTYFLDTLLVVTQSAVTELQDHDYCNVFPNPNKGDFQLSFNPASFGGNAQDIDIAIVDVSGKIVFSPRLVNLTTGAGKYAMDLHIANPGLYELILKAGSRVICRTLTIDK